MRVRSVSGEEKVRDLILRRREAPSRRMKAPLSRHIEAHKPDGCAQSSRVPRFHLAFVFLCDLLQSESKIAEVNRRSPGKRSLDRVFDLAIIGGGINGCGIARDAAGRGNSVFLCEMNDLASGTSSWSTKLVHGGLRYLEYYEFRLVREALIEREILWQIAPHIIRPLRFVLPHHAGLRPAWLLGWGCSCTTISAAGICCRRRARSISSMTRWANP